ncbi:hypothetical protein FH972_018679 [Carpinus fangiana]|uniref:Uncharacterized protein n=1 Tax=Carpinus fangiana TaxID=176857 RepID=A0A5N6RN85_9ROSI|nr:hypothetical protein FH972_018679 [Carpinus fangiana]
MGSISPARGFLWCSGKVVGLGLVKGVEEAGAVSGELGTTKGAGEQVGVSLLSVLHVRLAQMVPIVGFSEDLKPWPEVGSSVLVPDSGSDPNIPMEDGLTIPQWWLLDWLRDQVKNDDAQLAYLMDVEEEARQLNKVAIPLGAVEGSELMQVVIRALG